MIRRNIPFSEVEDASFRSFVFCLEDKVKMMSRSCARDNIIRMCDGMLVVLTRRLADIRGSKCVSVDKWSSECKRRNYTAGCGHLYRKLGTEKCSSIFEDDRA